MIGAPGVGAAYATGSVAVIAGAVVGAYFALPEDVQFGEVDYINDSFRATDPNKATSRTPYVWS